MTTTATTPTDAAPRAASSPSAAPAPGPARRMRLGEELPVFCERCGYALHGLPQSRCERCTILQFACPECGHHQPINTLRPAAMRLMGRVRAFFLGLWVFFKLNFFGWLLFAWFGMGVEWSFNQRSIPIYLDPSGAQIVSPPVGATPSRWTYHMVPRPVDLEATMAFVMFALAFGMVSRMLLLRWRHGWLVGATLGALVLGAVQLGAYVRGNVDMRWVTYHEPLRADFHLLSLGGAATILFGAVVVWPVWLALAHLFLPGKTAAALVEWQRSLSGGEFRRDPVLSGQ